MTGQTLGNYRVLERLGEGGMGEVYRAVDEMLDRSVALKMLRPELAHRGDVADRFRAEAVTLAKLDHPNIARLHGMTQVDAGLFMVMEFVPGDTLASRVDRQGRMLWEDAVDAVAQVLDGLGYAHGVGVVHRDIKPANLIVRPDGRVKITDFGIARVLGTSRATRSGFIVGTLEYMAPEQIRGEDVDERTDLYAAGIVLYQLLTGRVPFSATTEFELMRLHLEAAVPSIAEAAADAPAWLDDVIAKAVTKSPGARFPSAAAFRDELLRLTAEGRGVSSVKATRLAAAAPRPTRLANVRAAEPADSATVGGMARRLPGARAILSIAAGVALLVAAPFAWRALRATPVHTPAPAPVYDNAGGEPRVPIVTPPMRPFAPVVTPPESRPAAPRAPRATKPAPVPPTEPSGVAPVQPSPIVPPSAPDRVPPPAPAPTAATSNVIAARADTFFDDESLMEIDGKKTHQRDIIMRFVGARIELLDRKTRIEIRSVPLSRIESATYSRSKQPRWKAASAGVILGGVFAAPLFFLKGTQHWLTLEGTGDPVVIRLDKNSWERVIAEIEQRSAIKVAIAADPVKK
jgi:serine/threonine-protein kinase